MGMIKTMKEIESMRKGGKILAEVLKQVSQKAVPGVSTAFLNEEAHKLILEHSATPSFLGYKPPSAHSPYPAALCTSVNDEVVHAIPSNRELKEGDIIGLDLGLWFEGLCVDSAVTVGVGRVGKESKKLIDTTKQSLYEGIAKIKDGVKTGDIGNAIQTFVEKNGFSIVRDLAGHGVGNKIHEEPMVLNFGRKGAGEIIKEGMTLALEPMVNQGDYHVTVDTDGWGIRTADGKLSAHFEHTVLVTKDGYEILTE